MNYGNPARPNKYEKEVSQRIIDLQLFLEKHSRANFFTLWPETYYDNSGNPSRVIVWHYGRGREMRFNLQRNVSSKPAWTLTIDEFEDNKRRGDAEIQVRTFVGLKHDLSKLLGQHQD